MAMSTLTVAGINPGLNILGATQQLNFNQNLSTLQVNNNFIPLSLVSAQTNFEFRNLAMSGYRWNHLTDDTDTYGSLKLLSFVNASSSGTDLLSFSENKMSLYNDLNLNDNKIIELADPEDPQDASTMNYVDTRTITLSGAVTGTGGINTTIVTTLTDIETSQITDFETATTTIIGKTTILPSKLDGYPGNTTTFLRGDGTWTAVPIPTKAYFSLIMDSNTSATSITTDGAYVKVEGTTTTVLTDQFSASSSPSNRIIYTGTPAVNVVVQCNLDASHDALTDTILTFNIFKNGVIVPANVAPVSSSISTGSIGALGINAIIPLVTNDYIEIFTTASADPVDIIVKNLNFTGTAL